MIMNFRQTVSVTNCQCTEKKLSNRCPAQFPAWSHQNVHRMFSKEGVYLEDRLIRKNP